jgi:hypothetical protein
MSNEQELMLLVRRGGGLSRHLLRKLEHTQARWREKAALASLAESEPLTPALRPAEPESLGGHPAPR